MPKTTQQQTRLERENERLKAMVGELTMELKKATGKASSLPRRSPSFSRHCDARADSGD